MMTLRNIIRQTVVLPAPAEALFEMYLDPTMHQAITGAPVVIGGVKGALFEAFNGALSGKIVDIVRPSLIVQFWRSTEFKDADPDSILILSFTPEGDQGRIDLIHLDVPDQDFEGVTKGWEQYYWVPWRAYLEGKGEFALILVLRRRHSWRHS
jgi:activator of HSP90 ATPase